MAREATELERLIDEGLAKYGRGDLDGALLDWEQALSIDPENPQASSYVDYVRLNYELLTAEVNSDAESPAFAIAGDDDEYAIEILDGPLVPGKDFSPPLFMDPADEGWMFDEEPSNFPVGSSAEHAPPQTIEMEADEPDGTPAPNEGVSFEDATREYRAKPEPDAELDAEDSGRNEFAAPESTGGFQHETPTPHQFSGEATNLVTRSLGFVKATGVVETVSVPIATSGAVTLPVDTADAAGRRKKRPSVVPPELQMTLRTPGESDDDDAPELTLERGHPESAPSLLPPSSSESVAVPPPSASAPVSLSYDAEGPTLDRGLPLTADGMDLVSSLPSPRPAPSVRHITRDLPMPSRAPASSTNAPRLPIDDDGPDIELGAPGAPLGELPEPPRTQSATRRQIPLESLMQQLEPEARPNFSKAPTQDFEVATRDLPTGKLSALKANEPLISAPTRDLGIRPPRASTEDEPTGQINLTALKQQSEADVVEPAHGGTRTDIVLPFDPIDARSAQILHDLDEGKPFEESKDERTRRRITKLFDRAVEWTRSDDLDKAVAAVDLALSEDPNSALAQKLIQRHRETIQNTFQAFLGDLDRAPILARPLQELAKAPINPRAAFLLSRIDGTLTLDEILDVSGMPRLEAYRYLCQLFLRGILR